MWKSTKSVRYLQEIFKRYLAFNINRPYTVSWKPFRCKYNIILKNKTFLTINILHLWNPDSEGQHFPYLWPWFGKYVHFSFIYLFLIVHYIIHRPIYKHNNIHTKRKIVVSAKFLFRLLHLTCPWLSHTGHTCPLVSIRVISLHGAQVGHPVMSANNKDEPVKAYTSKVNPLLPHGGHTTPAVSLWVVPLHTSKIDWKVNKVINNGT